ncbi:MAG TPA: M13 family metallopeptidase N-terminal domain-containing protein, partial [Rhodanobacteraceae bacterium]|nr:M13 family metallopeptidase N-terminal domain-containing protein [Rhodanobacteraceae bacterium]
MHRKVLQPLALAVSLALSGGSAFAASSFDVTELDKSINPCNNFDGFVNAKWVAKNPIPADRTRWGAFDQLREHSLETQHDIAEKAAKGADSAKAGSIDQKIGWFYRSGMNEAAVEKAGYDPIKGDLAKIDALKTPADIVAWLTDTTSRGRADVFQVAVLPDFQNASTQIAYTFQGGLALPTKDYYEKPDYAGLRDAYKAHVAKILVLTGVPEADAKKQTDAVLAFETRLAKASFLPVELRDPKNQYHFVTIAEAD